MVVGASTRHGGLFELTSVDRLVERLQRSTPRLSRAWDWAILAFALLMAVVDLFLSVHAASAAGWMIGWSVPLVTVVSIVGVTVRRRFCAQAIVLVAGFSLFATASGFVTQQSLPPSFTALFVLAVLTTRSLHVENGRLAVALTLLAGIAVVGEPGRITGSGAIIGQVICLVCFAMAVGLGVYLRWIDWRRVAGEESARVDERLAIARELHDLVGHYVTAMVVQAQAGQHVVAQNPVAAGEALQRIEVAGSDALTAMRRMVGTLRDDAATSPLAGWGEVEALGATAVRDGLPLQMNIDPRLGSVPVELSASVHRIVVESLTNVRRHAREVTAVNVAVYLDDSAGPSAVVVRVDDNGVAAAKHSHDTYGLVGMRERAEALGGILYAGPASDGGWLVHAVFPVEAVPR